MGDKSKNNGRGMMASRIIILLIAAILACCTPLPKGDRQSISTAVVELARVKSESEQWAHRIKSDFKKGSTQYETAYSKYIPAKAKVDQWLDRLGVDLTARNSIVSSKEYQTALREASAKAEDFITYARGLYEKSLSPAEIVLLLPVFTDTGFKIWDKYRAASKETVEDVKKSLQSLKWKSFDET